MTEIRYCSTDIWWIINTMDKMPYQWEPSQMLANVWKWKIGTKSVSAPILVTIGEQI